MSAFPTPAPSTESIADLAPFQVAAITGRHFLQDDAQAFHAKEDAFAGMPDGQTWDDLYGEVSAPAQKRGLAPAGWWRLADAAVRYLLAGRTTADLTDEDRGRLRLPWEAGFTPAAPEDITALTDRQTMVAVGAWEVWSATAEGFVQAQEEALRASAAVEHLLDVDAFAAAAAARLPVDRLGRSLASAAVWHARALAAGSAITPAQREMLARPWVESIR